MTDLAARPQQNRRLLELDFSTCSPAAYRSDGGRSDEEGRGAVSGAALSMVLHEIRQPLAALSNVAALLAEKPEAPSLEPLVEIMTRSVEQIARLTEDFGEMSRLAVGGELRLRLEPCDLAELVRRLAAERAPGFRKQNQHLALRIPDVPLWLTADPCRLRQAIGNLLENASKYTPAGGSAGLSIRVDGTNAVLEVSDSGCGLAPEDQETIFDLFHRGDSRHAGLGIGLFLARRMVELHGGSIEASSEGRGKGSVFSVRLPLSKPDGAAADWIDPCVPDAAPPEESAAITSPGW